MQPLQEWLDTEVAKVKEQSTKWLSEFYFHRVENRPTFIDNGYMFSPADGVIMDIHKKIRADQPFIEAKGTKLTLQDLMDDEDFGSDGTKYMVVSIFMTFFSQHENYIPFAGNRTYYELPSISTYNKPMLAVEKDILKGVINPEFQEDYLTYNGREINTINSPKLGQDYHVVRLADYDVDSFINYSQSDGDVSTPYLQNDRFGKISYGSQCILIIGQYRGGVGFELKPDVKVGMYVKAKHDSLIKVLY